jgi:CRISPR/Cas system-associated endoribonuclease Cas2
MSQYERYLTPFEPEDGIYMFLPNRRGQNMVSLHLTSDNAETHESFQVEYMAHLFPDTPFDVTRTRQWVSDVTLPEDLLERLKGVIPQSTTILDRMILLRQLRDVNAIENLLESVADYYERIEKEKANHKKDTDLYKSVKNMAQQVQSSFYKGNMKEQQYKQIVKKSQITMEEIHARIEETLDLIDDFHNSANQLLEEVQGINQRLQRS